MRLLIVSEGPHELHGALPRLVERLLESDIAFETAEVRSRKVRRNLRPGQGAEYEKRLIAWIVEAHDRGFDGLIVVVDEDGKQERRAGAEAAQAFPGLPMPRAIGVAIRTFDAWMIADEKAWSKVLDRPVDRPPEPEKMRRPKDHARELQASSAGSDRLRELYAAVAAVANAAVIEERCPSGFAPFAERVRALPA